LLRKRFRIGDECLVARRDTTRRMYPMHRRTAEGFAKAGLAEFDVDQPGMAIGSIDKSYSDADILRTTRMGGRQDLSHQM
jgi:hypothetical protein